MEKYAVLSFFNTLTKSLIAPIPTTKAVTIPRIAPPENFNPLLFVRHSTTALAIMMGTDNKKDVSALFSAE